MSAKIFVGNLNPRTTRSQLADFFSGAGRVMSVTLPTDRETGRPRGFAFVEFSDRESAQEAMDDLEGRELEGHSLRLSWAREREELSDGRHPGRAARGGSETLPFGDEEELSGGRLHRDPRRSGFDRDRDDDADGSRRLRRRGKHGSDRKRGRGTRRVIE